MIRIIDNLKDFESIKEDCNRLADNFQMPLLRFEWLINCAETLSPNEKLHVFVLISDKIVKAIAPLVLVKNFFTERFEMLGASLHNEPAGFLYEDEHSLYELLLAIYNFKKSVFFNRIKDFSSEIIKLETIRNKAKRFKFINSGIVPYLPISESWENFQQTISASRRSNLRRLHRIAQNMGALSVEISSPTPDDVDKFLDEVFEVEASGWKKKLGTAMMMNNRLGRFFRSYSKEAAKLKMLRLCYLRINGFPVAAQIAIVHSNKCWILKIGYDEKYSRCAPGILLMNEIISYAFSKKLEAVEFLGSNENWLHIWTNQFHTIVTHKNYNSRVLYVLDIARNFTKHAIGKLSRFFLSKVELQKEFN